MATAATTPTTTTRGRSEQQGRHSPSFTPPRSQSPAPCAPPVHPRDRDWRMIQQNGICFNDAALHYLRDRIFNKSTAFTSEERARLGLRGLLPFATETLESQTARCYAQFREQPTPLAKYVYLNSLAARNETLFYSLLTTHLAEMVPIVYTPTVGEGCTKFNFEFRNTAGLYITKYDRGHIREILDNWPYPVQLIVVTDGGRILGLGDLGTNGMGIPVGKIMLYVAAALFDPAQCLPVLLDIGTNNKRLLDDPFYLGVREPRMTDEPEYHALVEEFMLSVKEKWPECLVQFEDFPNPRCFTILEEWQPRQLCFNDDIQGTGAVIMAGFVSAVRASGVPLADHRILFLGAGSAATGVATMICENAAPQLGISVAEAIKKHVRLFDIEGLVCKSRTGSLPKHLLPFAQNDEPFLTKFIDAVRAFRPTAIIGLSGAGPLFTEEVVRTVATFSEHPIVFALSNPTSKAEVSAANAYAWTDGKAVYASGSPFDPVEYKGRTLVPGQGNNMFIFPGLGFGAVLAKSRVVTNSMIMRAATELAACVTPEDMEKGMIYPPIDKIQEITRRIAAAVLDQAFVDGVAQLSERPAEDLLDYVRKSQWRPEYPILTYVPPYSH